jgi:hypothetical protein
MAFVTVEEPPLTAGACPNPEKRKPTQVVFEYTGEPCSASNNSQDPGKATCSGPLMGETPIQVVVTSDAVTVSPSTEVVSTGPPPTLVTFTATADRLKSEISFDIRQGGVTLQSLTVHTSCSQPLAVNDQFGSMRVHSVVLE